ncbi:MAG: hypothetical protein QM733_24570 [Ilumatobacteraceae bacterium]
MNKRIKKEWTFRLLGALLMLLHVSYAYPQDSTFKVSLASPTAASLGKYGDIPVGYHTGTPQISIPIYTINVNSLSLPISLRYHASGLKVQENASWVGAGWSLNAGGVITRTVIGEPDDRGYSSSTNITNGHFSDYGFSSYLFVPGTTVGHTSDNMIADDGQFLAGYKDGEPDMFFFNFGKYTGKFYFNDDRTPVLLPDADFKIVPDYTLSIGIKGFVVTTPDGIKYYFGMTGNSGTVTPIEVSFPFTSATGASNQKKAISAWYLNKIISADGTDSISLTYQSENYSTYALSMFPVASSAATGTEFTLVKNFIQGVRLSQISFSNGTVTLKPGLTARTDLSGYANQTLSDSANTGAFPLGSIQIADSNGFCKKDSFFTSYWHDASSVSGTLGSSISSLGIHSDAYRLRLDSVQETSCNAIAKIPPYKFSYYTEQVPRRLSLGVDHWGFYNGVTTNTGLIPTYSTTNGAGMTVYNGANRDPVWPAMRGGALNKITYPTGGFTNFTFEAHDVYNCTSIIQTSRLHMSVGYDGGTASVTGYITSNGSNPFLFVIYNNTGTYANGGLMNIYNSSNTIVGSFGTGAVGTLDSAYLILPAGTYSVVLTEPTPLHTGNGVEDYVTEYVPTVQAKTMIGGLRIQQISNNDGVTPTVVNTYYTYTGALNQSSGILYSRPIYVQTIRNDAYGLVWGPWNGTGGCAGSGVYLKSPSSIVPMATTQGEHVGYSIVNVTQTGNGRSSYVYFGSNQWDLVTGDYCSRTVDISTCNANLPSYPFAPVPFEPKRGELQYESHINQKGQLLKDIYYYPVYVQDSMITPGLIEMGSPFNVGTYYNLRSAHKVQDKQVVTDYDPDDSASLTSTRTTYYGSKYHHQRTREVISTSKGDSLATNYTYSFDYPIPACDALYDSLSTYLSAIHGDSTSFSASLYSCTPQVNYLTSDNSTSNCRFVQYQQLRRNLTLDRIAYLNRRLSYFSGPSDSYDALHLTAKNAADTILRPILRLQDAYANVPIETTSWLDTSIRHAVLFKYDTAVSPVGFAYPGRTIMISLSAPSTSFTKSAVSGNSLSWDSRYLDELYVKYASAHPQQVTGRDGVPVCYIWDYKNTQTIAKITNGAIADIAYTSFEADGTGGWTVGSATRDTTSAITGKKSFSLANGTCTKSGLTSSRTYVVSYWSKTGSSFTVSGSSSVKQGKTIGAWTYFEHSVTGVSSVSVSGSGGIDELRLYPANAQMTTYTYSPLVGMTTQCDVDSRCTYYFYDPLGRLQMIKDQDGNIVKTIDYHYMGQ